MNSKKVLKSLSLGLAMMAWAVPAAAENPFARMDTIGQQQRAEVEAAKADAREAEEAKHIDPNSPLAPYAGKFITKQIIVGNNQVPTEEIMAALKAKPGMRVTEQRISDDLNNLFDLGYFYDVQPELKNVPEGVQVTYRVMENPVYRNVKVQGNTVIRDSRIRAIFDMEKNKVANMREINRKAEAFKEEYRSNGYILARVTDIHLEQDGTLALTVNEGNVEGFKVKGNKKTKDYVVTREMRLKKGQPFNAKLARRSMQRVYNLGFFEDVNIKLNPGKEPNSVEVEIDVVEQSTGTFGIGAGYSNADGFVGMVSIGDKNFRGIGDSINIRWEFGGEDNKNYDFSYVKPWLDHKETKMSLNLYDITNEYADYDEKAHEIARYDKKRRGQELTFSRRTHNEYISNYISVKNRDDIYKGEADGYEGDADQYYEGSLSPGKDKWWYPHGKDKAETARLRQKENFGTTRSLVFGRVYDSRDNVYDPHEGKRISYSFEWAGLMGGDFDFRKLTAEWRYYFKAGRKNPTNVWAWDFSAGYASGDMPLHQRFSMGGSDTLRGYEDDQFRGNSMLKATLEYRFPIVKKVQGVLFNDNGYAWDKRHEDRFDVSKMKSSVGLGLRVNSPLGPIKLDYGFGDNGGKFHFSFGGQF